MRWRCSSWAPGVAPDRRGGARALSLPAAVLDGLGSLLGPLDALRRALYRALAPWLGRWIRDRQVRIGLHGSTVVAVSFALAVVAPLWLLALGPLLLGVPHLLSDGRYLVARPGLHRRRGAPWVGALLLSSTVFVDVRWGLLAAVVAPLLARGSWGRRLLVATPPALLLTAALGWSAATQLALAHVHNLVAVLLWGVLTTALHPPSPTARWAGATTVVPLFVGGSAILMGGVDGWTHHALGPSLAHHVRSLAPGAAPELAVRWVVLFAYAQAVHYGLWLRVVPEVGRRRPAPRSWRASLAALRRDVGDPLLAAVGLLAVGIAAWGFVDLVAARQGYLRLALFHGPLELAVLAVVAVEGRSVLRP